MSRRRSKSRPAQCFVAGTVPARPRNRGRSNGSSPLLLAGGLARRARLGLRLQVAGQAGGGNPQQARVVVEEAQAPVALAAQQTPYAFPPMIVVDVQPAPRLRLLPAEPAAAFLLGEEGVVLL